MPGNYMTQGPPLQQTDTLNYYRTVRYTDDPNYLRKYKLTTTLNKCDTGNMNNQMRYRKHEQSVQNVLLYTIRVSLVSSRYLKTENFCASR
jgi:hypothetical protein